MSGLTTADLIGRYIQIRDHIAAMTKQHEESLKPYQEALQAIEGAVTEEINRLDGQSVKTEQGTAYRSEWTAVKVADRETFLDFVFAGRHEGFITNATSKEAVKEFIDAHNGQVPPGLDFTRGYKTLFRRA